LSNYSSVFLGIDIFTDLREGDNVTFEIEKTEKGNAAVNVEKA